jgi:hypothetical protein
MHHGRRHLQPALTPNSLLHKPRNGPDRLPHRAPDQGFWNARGSRIGFVQQAAKRHHREYGHLPPHSSHRPALADVDALTDLHLESAWVAGVPGACFPDGPFKQLNWPKV